MKLTRQKATLLGIFTLFFAPMLLVIAMQSPFWDYRPEGLKNHGELVQPPVPLQIEYLQHFSSKQGLKGKWLLLYVLTEPCERSCSTHVAALRQIYKAAGKNQEHLALAVLVAYRPSPGLRQQIESIYPQFNFIVDTQKTILTTLTDINTQISNRSDGAEPFHTYILDPMHNVVLAYRNGTNPNYINNDLKRLLKWSK